MNKMIFAAVASIFVASGANATTVLGCEVKPVDGTNYSVKVDPNCAFDEAGTGSVTPIPSPLPSFPTAN
jgi:hypothetical protein